MDRRCPMESSWQYWTTLLVDSIRQPSLNRVSTGKPGYLNVTYVKPRQNGV